MNEVEGAEVMGRESKRKIDKASDVVMVGWESEDRARIASKAKWRASISYVTFGKKNLIL